MPFYLVTYTGLVEAEDEVGAAEKVMEKLQIEPRLTFAVKLDENSIKHVSVDRRSEVAHEVPSARSSLDAGAGMPASQAMQRAEAMGGDAAKPATSVGVIGAVFLALSFAACGIAGLFHFGPFRLF